MSRQRGELLAHLRHPTTFFPRDARALARTTVSVVVLAPALVFTALAVLVLGLLRAPRRWVDACYTGYAHFAARVGGTTIHVEGLEHATPGAAYVVVANHESDWDPVVAFAALDRLRMRAVIKREMIRIPIVGTALRASGNVCVDRDERGTDAGRVAEVMKERPPDVSSLFYAEGTRARDGALHPFKKGPFVTAIRYGMPILPIATAGTYRVWPPNTLQVRALPVTVAIGPPIDTAGLALDDRDALRDRCHETIRELRDRARSRLRALGGEPGGID
jgi:1-acyl-sn-glycerol-3-phosphate acyltransferase